METKRNGVDGALDMEAMRRRAEDVPDYDEWEDGRDIIVDAIERMPRFAADVLALCAEVERLRGIANAAEAWRRDKAINGRLIHAKGSRVEVALANALTSAKIDSD